MFRDYFNIIPNFNNRLWFIKYSLIKSKFMNFILIVLAAIIVGGVLIALSIWLTKKGVTKDDNDNYIPDVLEDKVKNVKTKVKEVKNIVKSKK